MNPDTAPIEEVEAWLIGKTIPYPACLKATIGPSMDAAIACLPPGWDWSCTAHNWYAVNLHNPQQHVELVRINSPRDELVRLAAKAWMAQEENNEK